MLQNIFKKAKRLIEPTKDPQVLIAEIHNEFDTSAEKLLIEAKNILAVEMDTKKGEQLAKLGFTRSKQAVETRALSVLKESKHKVAGQIQYFQTFYPSNKFITEGEVERICKKYGLLCGDAESYIGDIPNKNLQEISVFNLREEDCVRHRCGYWRLEHGGGFSVAQRVEKEYGSFGYVKEDKRNRFAQVIPLTDEGQDFVYERPSFKICAPIKDFDTTSMEVSKGYILSQKIEDPIVLQPVKGGYLIVSKWGLEASDESVVNEKMN